MLVFRQRASDLDFVVVVRHRLGKIVAQHTGWAPHIGFAGQSAGHSFDSLDGFDMADFDDKGLTFADRSVMSSGLGLN